MLVFLLWMITPRISESNPEGQMTDVQGGRRRKWSLQNRRSRPQHWRDNLGTVSWSCVSDFQFLLNVLCLCSCSYSVFVVLIVSYVVGLFLCSLLLVCLVSHVYFLPVSRLCVSVFASCLSCRVHRAGLYFLCLVGQILLTCVPWCVSSPWLPHVCLNIIVLFHMVCFVALSETQFPFALRL